MSTNHITSAATDLSIFQHNYLIGLYNGRQPMSHYQGCSSLRNAKQGLLNLFLSLCIQSRRSYSSQNKVILSYQVIPSSKIKIGGFFTIIREIAILCFSPPLMRKLSVRSELWKLKRTLSLQRLCPSQLPTFG